MSNPDVTVLGVPVQAPNPRAYPFSGMVQEERGERVTVTPPEAAAVLLTIAGALAAGEVMHVLVTGFYRGAAKQGIISGECGVARLGAAAAAAGAFAGGLVAVTGAAYVGPLTLVPVAGGVELRMDASGGSEVTEVQAFAHVTRQAAT